MKEGRKKGRKGGREEWKQEGKRKGRKGKNTKLKFSKNPLFCGSGEMQAAVTSHTNSDVLSSVRNHS